MSITDILHSIKITETLALENYNQRNGVVDYRLEGVCNHYFPVYEGVNPSYKLGEILLTPIVISAPPKPQIHLLFVININTRAGKGAVSPTGGFG